MQQCAVCRAAASQRCCACQSTFYCSREHQKVDWYKHKKQCRPFKVCHNETLGRHLVATRDIKPGEVLIKEAALVSGPQQNTVPVCLGCYKLLKLRDHVDCPRGCGWPMCSQACAESAAHKPECEFTRNYRGDKVVVRNFELEHPMYQCVTVLRCLALPASSGAGARLRALESHCAERRRTGRYESDRASVARVLLTFFKLQGVVDEEDILRMCGVLQVNGHEVPVSEPCHVAVYDVTSLLEHTCVPNCAKSFTSSGEVIVRAACGVSRGTHLSISYTDALWGTANRRHHLAETKFFSCRCERCKDPTELGTNFSAVKCLEGGCAGYQLPVDPLLDEREGGDICAWACSSCGAQTPGLQVAQTIEQVGQRLAQMQKGNAKACELFLSQLGGRVLHPNHYYLADVRLALAQLLGQDDRGLPGLDDAGIERKVALCGQMLDLGAKIFPAEFRVRGVLTFELHAAIAESARRKASRGEIDPSELAARLLESKRLLEQTLFLLKCEPEVLPEGKIAAQAQRNLADLDVVLQRLHKTIGDSPF